MPADALLATGIVSVCPARSTVSVSTVPAGWAVIIELSDVCPSTGLPSTDSMTSPAFSALLAGIAGHGRDHGDERLVRDVELGQRGGGGQLL